LEPLGEFIKGLGLRRRLSGRVRSTNQGRGVWGATRQVGTILVFGVAPAAIVILVLAASFLRGPVLYDFRGGLYDAAHDIVQGQNPYRASGLADEAAVQKAGGHGTQFSVPVYPAPALVAVVPLAQLPYRLAALLFVVLSIGGLALALYLVGVRDWRCYGVAFGSWPVVHGLMLGAVTPLLVLGVAVAWRLRGRLGSAAAVAALIAVKVFPWPLAVWLLVSKQWRLAAVAATLAVAVTVAAWSAIGFDGLTAYPRMLRDLALIEADATVSLSAGLIALGLSFGVAHVCALLVAVGLLGRAAWLAREPGGERACFILVVVAALIASPIVWPHYLALLLVPIALVSPRLSPLWLVPVLAYLAPVAHSQGHPWAIAPYLAMCAVVASVGLRPDGLRSSRAAQADRFTSPLEPRIAPLRS
jgi:Glycosyltransferase family 87